MRTVLLSKKAENYLHKSVDEHKFALGIIIGQKTDEKYYIVHLAKLSEDEESQVNPSQDTDSVLESVDVQSLADQWISAFKMTPGSFDVIGVFLAHKDGVFNEEKQGKTIKTFLGQLNEIVTNNSSICGYQEERQDIETLLLCYSISTSNASCKMFSNSSSGGNLMPVDCKIVDKLPQWYLFESNYELDDVFPITEDRKQVNVEDQFRAALQSVKTNVYNSEIFIELQNVEDNITLENHIKETFKKNDVTTLKASILLTTQVSNEFMIKIRPYNGTIRFSGIVSSRVWCQSKTTFKKIKDDIRKDILRSLAARIQIYCDGLTDLHSNNVGVVISEPPRRIYFYDARSEGIQFSDYIFRGETPSVAVVQAKQILDMDVNSNSIFDDLEGLPDDDTTSMNEETPSLKGNAGPEISRAMYMLGISVALLVLLLSVLLHYLFL